MNLSNNSVLTLALFLAVLNNRLVELFVAPIFEKYWPAHKWLVLYVSMATATMIVWFTDITLFAEVIHNPLGKILTGIVVGGGSNLIHDLFDSQINLLRIFKLP